MKKSKLFLACMAGVLGLTTFVFAGCSNNGGSEGGGGGANPGGGDNPGGGTDQPSVQDPKLESMGKYFRGARATLDTNTILDENHIKQNFSTLLDRQISVLAEDMLYRLFITYGDGTYGATSDYQSLNLLEGNYTYNGNNAMVSKQALLTKSNHNNNLTHDIISGSEVYPNIDCIFCYQNIINDGLQNDLYNPKTINFSNAIYGKYTKLNSRNELTTELNTEKQWKITDLKNADAVNALKMSIAKVLTNDTNYLSGDFSQSEYETLLNKVNTLGFNNQIKAKLVEIINNNVIGATLVNENANVYNNFGDKDKYDFTWYTQNTDMHLFKGYNIVVPAIVDMALSNTFDGTSTSLYPVANKQGSKVLTFETLKTANEYKEVYLMPNSSSVKPTKIELNVTGDAGSVGKTIGIYVTIRNAAGVIKNNVKVGNVTLSTSAQKVEALLDTETIGMFTGNTSADYLHTSLFGNNTAMPSDTILYGNNYIKFSFENISNAKFGLNFLGMYDKLK